LTNEQKITDSNILVRRIPFGSSRVFGCDGFAKTNRSGYSPLDSLTVGSVKFDRYCAVLIMAGKTVGRRVRIIFSAKALAEWLNRHPSPENADAPLWTNFESVGSIERLEYGACSKMLTEAARRCHIKKRVNPHSFRHARASSLANVLTEAQMNEYLG